MSLIDFFIMWYIDVVNALAAYNVMEEASDEFGNDKTKYVSRVWKKTPTPTDRDIKPKSSYIVLVSNEIRTGVSKQKVFNTRQKAIDFAVIAV